jgi:hypothetical protein
MTKIPHSNRMDQVVRYDLKEDIIRDIKNHKIFYEGDLQSCVYYHLRNYSRRIEGPKWAVLNKPYLKKEGVYPDIVMFRGSQPKIAIELKWWDRGWNERTGNKDRSKLKVIRTKYPTVSKGFFLYVYDKQGEDDEKFFYGGSKWENFYYFDIPINIRDIMSEAKYEEWVGTWIHQLDVIVD